MTEDRRTTKKRKPRTPPAEESIAQEEDLRSELFESALPFSEWKSLSPEVKAGVKKLGYKQPTPVQQAAIEPLLEGHDLIVQAKTGTGKTATFGIPLVEKITAGQKQPQALLLAPTRELATQVSREVAALGEKKKLVVVPLYGGVSIGQQIEQLEEGADIVAGTPGRVLDHIRRQTLDTQQIKSIVLDEADEMLSMGFFEEVTSILDRCSSREQILLFSATIPSDIERLARQYLKEPLRLMVSGDERKVEGIQNVIYFRQATLPPTRNLLYILEHEGPRSAIIFCNTRDESAMVASYLARQGKNAEAIHGEMQQRDRERVLKKLRDGKLQFMVATDIAARGIDISELSHVINYNFPDSTDQYLHRVGRTGRLGRRGVAISMVSGSDLFTLVQLRRLHKIYFEERQLPPAPEIVQIAAARHLEGIHAEALDELFEPFLPLAEALLLHPKARVILALLLKRYYENQGKQPKKTRSKSESSSVDPTSFTRLYVGIGTAEGYDSTSLIQMLGEEINIRPDQIKTVQMEKHYCFVEADSEASEKILASFQERRVGDFTITAEVAKKRTRRRR